MKNGHTHTAVKMYFVCMIITNENDFKDHLPRVLEVILTIIIVWIFFKQHKVFILPVICGFRQVYKTSAQTERMAAHILYEGYLL